MKNAFLIIFLCLTELRAETIYIFSTFYVDHLPVSLERVKARYDVRVIDPFQWVSDPEELMHPEVKKILIFNPFVPPSILSSLPKEKLILFIWEPEVHELDFYGYYNQVLTWDDNLIDNTKFFRFNYPYLTPMKLPLIDFQEKRFCTLINSNWVSHRLKILDFFAEKPLEDFEYYGFIPPPNRSDYQYKGRIPGSHTGDEKIAVLSQYKFCICFENIVDLQGYVTEKILGCFAAGCVPVYWGPRNITDYIPEECFIDYRNFKNDEELYQYLKNMTPEVYENYSNSIKMFLLSREAQQFSPEDFIDRVLNVINR